MKIPHRAAFCGGIEDGLAPFPQRSNSLFYDIMTQS